MAAEAGPLFVQLLYTRSCASFTEYVCNRLKPTREFQGQLEQIAQKVFTEQHKAFTALFNKHFKQPHFSIIYSPTFQNLMQKVFIDLGNSFQKIYDENKHVVSLVPADSIKTSFFNSNKPIFTGFKSFERLFRFTCLCIQPIDLTYVPLEKWKPMQDLILAANESFIEKLQPEESVLYHAMLSEKSVENEVLEGLLALSNDVEAETNRMFQEVQGKIRGMQLDESCFEQEELPLTQ